MKRILSICVLMTVLAFSVAGTAFAEDYSVQGKPFDFDQDFDLGGRTVTFVGSVDALGWNDSASVTQKITAVSPERVKEAEEKFNCKIESLLVPANEATPTRLARLLSGESGLDVWVGVATPAFEGSIGQQIFFPVSDILPQEYWEALPPMHYASAKTLEYRGKIFGFGAVGSGVVNLSFLAYNKTIIERDGLPDPYELYQNGEWTWQAMMDLAQQATVDLDGDGKVDRYGLAYIASTDSLGRLAYSNNASFTKTDESGRIVFSFDEPNALEAMRFHKEMVDLKVMAPSGDPISQFMNGQAVMDLGMMPWYMMYRYPNMSDEYGLVPVPMGPSSDSYTFVPRDGESTALPANSEEPLALIALVDFLFPNERLTEDYFNTVYMEMSSSREVFQTLKRGHAEWDGSYHRLWNQCAHNGLWDAVRLVVIDGKTPAAAIEEVKPRIQAVIDEVYRQ